MQPGDINPPPNMQNNFYNSCKLYVTAALFLITGLSSTLKPAIVAPDGKMLPVKLIDATIRHNDKTLQIKWADFSAGVKQYDIEYSTDEKKFTVIGTVQHINNQVNYQFDKSLLQSNAACIRIKSIGNNTDDYTYSAIRKLTGNTTRAITSIAVFPNPASTALFFLDYDLYKNCAIKITDSSAAVVSSTKLTQNAVAVKKLAAGSYKFQVFKDGIAVAKGKFVKQ
jgi:hypothetical protein